MMLALCTHLPITVRWDQGSCYENTYVSVAKTSYSRYCGDEGRPIDSIFTCHRRCPTPYLLWSSCLACRGDSMHYQAHF
jgi:hypothetical protein